MPHTSSQALIAFLMEKEEFRESIYDDATGRPLAAGEKPLGKATIGYGHVVRKDDHFPATITREFAETLLRFDVIEFGEKAVNAMVKVSLTQAQYDALVSIQFNSGAVSARKSTLRDLLNVGEYIGACAEFAKWHHAGGKRSKGLLRRRVDEMRMFLSS